MKSVTGKIGIVSVVVLSLFISGCGLRLNPFASDEKPAVAKAKPLQPPSAPEVVMTSRKPVKGSAPETGIRHDPLSSWANLEAKARIKAFVKEATTAGAEGFVPEADRIATFDMDGTIYCEKPYWLAMTIAMDKLRETAAEFPEVEDKTPYREVLKIDPADPMATAAGHFPESHFLLCLTVPFTGWSLDEYKGHVRSFCESKRDRKFNNLYKDMFYKPMVELIEYLNTAKFRVYIVSGSEQSLVRAACSPVLGLDPSRYIGTLIALDLTYTDNGVRFLKEGTALEPSNIGDGKPKNIQYQIGKSPVLAVGNTSGDLGMLTMATTNPNYKNTLGVVLHHNDDVREYGYSDEKLLEKAADKGWLVVRMKEDFKQVFMKGN